MRLSLIIVGYVISLPVVIYGIMDLARIPGRLYNFTTYSRRTWILAIVTGYACFGLGGILMTVAWLRSPERTDLLEDLTLDARWDPSRQTRTGAITRATRRRERQRRQRLAFVAMGVPIVLAIGATATRFS